MPRVESKPDKNPYTQLFASWLKDFRERQGLSERRMAGILGVDEGTLSRVESSQRWAPRKFARNLSMLPEIAEHIRPTLVNLTDQELNFAHRLAMAASCGWDFAHHVLDHPPILDEADPSKSRIVFVKGMKIQINLSEQDNLTEKGRQYLLEELADVAETTVRTKVDLMERSKQRRAKYYLTT